MKFPLLRSDLQIDEIELPDETNPFYRTDTGMYRQVPMYVRNSTIGQMAVVYLYVCEKTFPIDRAFLMDFLSKYPSHLPWIFSYARREEFKK